MSGSQELFRDTRSKSIVLVAHCVLNANSISDGTADYPGALREIVELLGASGVGILQMPCPELNCLGLDRGNVLGGSTPVIEENSRIRRALSQPAVAERVEQLARHVAFQLMEYKKYGFDIRGLIGVNRSPSCGVNTTSVDNKEVEGEGVFIEALRRELERRQIPIKMIGIKSSQMEAGLEAVRSLIG